MSVKTVQDIIFGIDLGTTHCSCGYAVDDFHDVIIMTPNSGIPSLLRYTENGVEVGEQLRASFKQGVIKESKRLIGKQFKENDIQQEIKNNYFPFDIVEGKDGEVMIKTEVAHKKDQTRTVEEKLVHPYEGSSGILKYLKNTISSELQLDVSQSINAVITVPAYFTSEQRERIKTNHRRK